MSSASQKLGLPALIALVVGSMVGAGVFSLPATFGRATGVLGALIAWVIAGTGMLMLAFVFQTLAVRKPDLDAGVYAYAKAGFGQYLGFLSALGFWAGSCVGNVSYFILIKATLGAFFPVFGDGNTVIAIVISSVLLWGFYFLIIRGVQEAAGINTIVTIAKIVPIVIFLILAIIYFSSDVFSANFLGQSVPVAGSTDLAHLDQYGYVGHSAVAAVQEATVDNSLFSQVRNTMLVTVFVFLGIEGASVYSRYARERKYVGIATVLGFLGVLCLFVMITIFSYGIMPRAELAALRQPSMAGVLEAMVGRWGSIFISAGLIVSVLGAYLSWTLLASEILFSAAKYETMPRFLASENEKKVPHQAVLLTCVMVQIFLIVTAFSDYAFRLALELTSALSLVPYLLVAMYGLKLVHSGETYGNENRTRDFTIALVATVYTIGMLYAGGLKYILLSALIYGPGTLLYVRARKEQGKTVFSNNNELLVFGVIALTALVALLALVMGYISI